MDGLRHIPFVLAKHSPATLAVQRTDLVDVIPGTKEDHGNLGLRVAEKTADETVEDFHCVGPPEHPCCNDLCNLSSLSTLSGTRKTCSHFPHS